MTAPVLMSNLAPWPGAGHFGSLDRPFGQRPSSMGARIAQRVEGLSHPKEGDLLAFRFDQLGLLVFQLIRRGHIHQFGHRPFLLWVGSVFDRSFLQPLPSGFANSVLRRARLDPGVVDEELLVQRDEVFRLFRRLVLGEDRLHWAHRLAGPAVDTLVGVDEKLARPLIDAVHRADLDAGLVLDVDARLDDHVRHGDLPSSAPPLSSGVDDSVTRVCELTASEPAQGRGLQLTDPLPLVSPKTAPISFSVCGVSTLTPNRRRMTCASLGCKAAKARSTPAASSLVWASSSGERA